MGQASVIVVGNEKGGAGKSTLAIHIATALLHGQAKVAVLDLDLRQQTLGHFFANRAKWLAAAVEDATRARTGPPSAHDHPPHWHRVDRPRFP